MILMAMSEPFGPNSHDFYISETKSSGVLPELFDIIQWSIVSCGYGIGCSREHRLGRRLMADFIFERVQYV